MQRTTRTRQIAPLLIALLLTLAVTASAQVSVVPQLMNFQGRLTKPNGTPVADGNYSVRFSLWSAVSGGTEKWNQTLNPVTVRNGTFAVLLSGFPAGTFNSNLWLEIKVGVEAPLTPRQQLVSVAYAMKANSVPDGAITGASILNGTITAVDIANGTLTADKFASGIFNPLAWLLGGNSGTNPANHFLGTTDNQPLIFKANSRQAMRYTYAENKATAGQEYRGINVLGGSEINEIGPGIVGATLSGGGKLYFNNTSQPNRILADFGTISGGLGNEASGPHSTVGGGIGNKALRIHASVGGGNNNSANGDAATVAGGNSNLAQEGAVVGGGFNNGALGLFSKVGGGEQNIASGAHATLGGGLKNKVLGLFAKLGGGELNEAQGSHSFVGGGFKNLAIGLRSKLGGGELNIARGAYSVVGGGKENEAGEEHSIVVGGLGNKAFGRFSFVVGGEQNEARKEHSIVGGGHLNRILERFGSILGGEQNEVSAEHAIIGGGLKNVTKGFATFLGGGEQNTILAPHSVITGGISNIVSGIASVIMGGSRNSASGHRSVAAGNRAKANHNGTFVWGDDTEDDFFSTGLNQFLIRATGGVGINKNNPTAALDINGIAAMTGFRMGAGEGVGRALICDLAGNGLWRQLTAAGIADGAVTVEKLAPGIFNSLVWRLGGNSGVTSGFLGTTDNNPLIFKVNNRQAMRYTYAENTATAGSEFRSINVLGGAEINEIGPNVVGATISGGGRIHFNGITEANQALADFSTIGGGVLNKASGLQSTVGGGSSNRAMNTNATVGGGFYNFADGGAATVAGGNSNLALEAATVGGGQNNTALGSYSKVGGGEQNQATHEHTTIGGGKKNLAAEIKATVGGGEQNTARGPYSIVGGGYFNTANGEGTTVAGGNANTANGLRATIGGGDNNVAGGGASTIGGGVGNQVAYDLSTVAGGGLNTARNTYATIGGGWSNVASGLGATIGGGGFNTASALWATVGGGQNNYAVQDYSFVGGGYQNAAVGTFSTVSGGRFNVAYGNYSFAAGQQAQANYDGSFVWNDASDLLEGNTFASTGINQFLIRATGGVGINKNNPIAGALDVAGNAFVSGKVGIGSTNASPQNPLVVAGSGGQGGSLDVGVHLGLDVNANPHIELVGNSTTPYIDFNNDTLSDFKARIMLSNSSTLRAIAPSIVLSGNVGINTNNPASYALNVNGTANFSGNITVNGTTYTSDARYKQNIASLDNALDAILSLRGVTFDWKPTEGMNFTTGRQIGFIAQEVEKVLPPLVTTDSRGYKSVAYANVVPVLVEAFKTQQKQMETLKKENVELKAKLDSLLERLERLERERK